MSQNKLNVSISPHLKKDISVKKVMWLVIAALLPAYIHTIYLYGISTVWVSLTAVSAAVISEAGMQKLFKKEVTVSDGSAILTALLLTFNVPPSIALWKVALATVFAIVVAKQLFGGLGYNIFNPALVGRAFLVASYPVAITSGWIQPKGGFLSISQKSAAAIEATGAEATKLVDTVTSATPLTALKSVREAVSNPELHDTAISLWDKLYSSDLVSNAFFGKIGGCLGETTAITILIGGLFLIIMKIVDWRIPLGYIGTLGLLTWAFGGHSGLFSGNPFFHLFTGGLMLGAFFMATDMVTSPLTKKGRWIFAVSLGLLTFIIRMWGGYPEGVSYSILLMNIFVPLIDRYTVPKPFGGVQK